MFNSNILDAAVGLVFVFLTLSLICSAASELIDAWFKKRSKELERGIQELLGDLKTTPGSDDFVTKLYNHGLINSLYKGKYSPENKPTLPSYIPSANFAMAVLSLVASFEKEKMALPVNLQSALDAFKTKVGDDKVLLQRELEHWYDSAMDRVSGWYKRWNHQVLLGLGLAVAIAVNADAIGIVRRLSTDTNFRQSVARMAEAAAAKPAPTQSQTTQQSAATGGAPAAPTTPGNGAGNSSSQPGQAGSVTGNGGGPNTVEATQKVNEAVAQLKENFTNLDGIGLPLGWTKNTITSPRDFGLHLIGWLITALAVSLGAPFWFDMLNKFMVVRSTVKPKEKSKEEKSKDPTAQK